jgi:hypothetical protein
MIEALIGFLVLAFGLIGLFGVIFLLGSAYKLIFRKSFTDEIIGDGFIIVCILFAIVVLFLGCYLIGKDIISSYHG